MDRLVVGDAAAAEVELEREEARVGLRARIARLGRREAIAEVRDRAQPREGAGGRETGHVAGDVEVAGGVRAATEPLPVADPPGVRSARAVGREDASADRIAGVVGAGVAVRAGEGRMEAALRRVAGIRSAGVTVVAESGGVSAAARGIAEVVRARIAVVTLCRRVGMGAA